MKPIYDDDTFFEAYSKMPRSTEGLRAAGEWHQLEPLMPDMRGKRVLDLGCGYGWHCQYAAQHGAAHVVGIDISEKMLQKARQLNTAPIIDYQLVSLLDYAYQEDDFDVVVSNLALHYIDDLDKVFTRVYRTLRRGGVFLINIEHPTFTAGVNQDFLYDAQGKALCYPIDNYFIPGERITHFLGKEVRKQHHTLTQILMGLLNAGFTLRHIEEAQPDKDMLALPHMQNELRRPMMLLIKAQKD